MTIVVAHDHGIVYCICRLSLCLQMPISDAKGAALQGPIQHSKRPATAVSGPTCLAQSMFYAAFRPALGAETTWQSRLEPSVSVNLGQRMKEAVVGPTGASSDAVPLVKIAILVVVPGPFYLILSRYVYPQRDFPETPPHLRCIRVYAGLMPCLSGLTGVPCVLAAQTPIQNYLSYCCLHTSTFDASKLIHTYVKRALFPIWHACAKRRSSNSR